MMDFEAQRDEHIKAKTKLLADLNLEPSAAKTTKRDGTDRHATKKRKLSFESKPTRTSARMASSDKPSYREESEKYNFVKPPRSRVRTSKTLRIIDIDSGVRNLVPTTDAEDIRAGWNKWKADAEPPVREESGTFHFNDFPSFTPNKSPAEVIREGCFGGSYFRPLKSKKLGILIENDWQEIPASWCDGLDIETYMTSPVYSPDVNKFKVACGQSIEEWEANGWIAYDFDIRGWFQWYCRFFLGRRCDDDERQVSRWRKCVGGTGRWRRMLLKKYLQMGVRDVFDDGEEENKEVSPVMHQTCHHWAYGVKQQDLDDAWSGR